MIGRGKGATIAWGRTMGSAIEWFVFGVRERGGEREGGKNEKGSEGRNDSGSRSRIFCLGNGFIYVLIIDFYPKSHPSCGDDVKWHTGRGGKRGIGKTSYRRDLLWTAGSPTDCGGWGWSGGGCGRSRPVGLLCTNIYQLCFLCLQVPAKGGVLERS